MKKLVDNLNKESTLKHVLLTNYIEYTVIREESLGIGPTFVECFYFQSSM